MRTQTPTGQLAEWAYRNPNGLQPFVAFTDDYATPGRLHYNVPPPHVEAKRSSLPITTASRSMQWRGYNGSKPFFTQQPPPGAASFLLNGGYAPHRTTTDSVISRQTDPHQTTLLCNSMSFPVTPNTFRMRNVTTTEIHPSQMKLPDSRVWRFDGRSHDFPKTPC
ncbi:unnamed protein product [Hydatigera taeniaeformis]|uniref:Uncharacterized protein n=1 Tax=Hydatigena taeniaeformis TaxID=6205 RepID=A0A0R3WXL4_HYDTA|nr:unnamed protein product [Hydatigera taeniaeformis]